MGTVSRLRSHRISGRFPPASDYDRGFYDAQAHGLCRRDFSGAVARTLLGTVTALIFLVLFLLVAPGRAAMAPRAPAAGETTLPYLDGKPEVEEELRAAIAAGRPITPELAVRALRKIEELRQIIQQ